MWLICLKFYNPHRKPPHGWPVVIDYFTVPDNQRSLDAEAIFKRRLDLTELPVGYTLYHQHVGKPLKQRSPETILAGRLRRLKNRMNKKFPLFAADFIREKIEQDPDAYSLDNIRIVQQEKQKLDDEYRSLNWLEPLMTGNDSWKTYNHGLIRKYLKNRLKRNRRRY